MGGFLGAGFVHFNVKLNSWRKGYYYQENKYKILELVIVALVTSSLSILGPLAWSCQPNTNYSNVLIPSGNLCIKYFFVVVN